MATRESKQDDQLVESSQDAEKRRLSFQRRSAGAGSALFSAHRMSGGSKDVPLLRDSGTRKLPKRRNTDNIHQRTQALDRLSTSMTDKRATISNPYSTLQEHEGSLSRELSATLNKKALEAHTLRAELTDSFQHPQGLDEVTYRTSLTNSVTKDGGLLQRQRLSLALSDTPTTSTTTKRRLTGKQDKEINSDELHWYTKVSPIHERVICIVIGLNCVTMGMEMDLPWEGWFWVNQVMLVAYILDLALRVYNQDFWEFLRGGWNWLDSIIVISSVLDMWIIPLIFIHDSSKGQFVGSVSVVLRLPRLLRIFRILTVVKTVRPLYNLLVGLSEAFGAIFWFLVLVCVLLYAFALIFHQMFARGWESLSEEANERGKEVFSTVVLSFFSLFRVMAADMTDLGPILSDCHDWSLPLWYMAFQMCSSWLLLSTLTATVIDTVLASNAKREREEEFRRVRDEREQVTEGLQETLGELANMYDELHLEELREFLDSKENADLLRKLVNKEPFEALQDWEALQIEGFVQLDDFIEHLQAGSHNQNIAGNVFRLESRVLRLQSSMDQVLAFLPALRNIGGIQEPAGSRQMSTTDEMLQSIDSRQSMAAHSRQSTAAGSLQSMRRPTRTQATSASPPRRTVALSVPKDDAANSSEDSKPAAVARRPAVTHTTLLRKAGANLKGALPDLDSPRDSDSSSTVPQAQAEPTAVEAESANNAVCLTVQQEQAPPATVQEDLNEDALKDLHDDISNLRRELNGKVEDLQHKILDALSWQPQVGIRGSQDIMGTASCLTRGANGAPDCEVVNVQELSHSIAKAIQEGLAASEGVTSGGTATAVAAATGPAAVARMEASTESNIAAALKTEVSQASEHPGRPSLTSSLTAGKVGTAAAMEASSSCTPAPGSWLQGTFKQISAGSPLPVGSESATVIPRFLGQPAKMGEEVLVPTLPLAAPGSHGDAAGGVAPAVLQERDNRRPTPSSPNAAQVRPARGPVRLVRSAPDVARGRSPAHSSSATHSPEGSARSQR